MATNVNVDQTCSVSDLRAITPNDAADIPGGWARGLYVGVGGAVKVTTATGQAITLTGLAAGVWHPMAVTRVWVTGTTATSILVGR